MEHASGIATTWDMPAVEDDALVKESLGESGKIVVVGDKAAAHLHELPEQWLRARVRGWMELCESPDLAYWIGTYAPNGTWIYCSSNGDNYQPKTFRQVYAQKVARHLNKHCNFGGAWLAGWFRGGKEFYLLWKDETGDLQIPIECNKPFIAIVKWPVETWERQACTAYSTWKEIMLQNEVTKKDTVKLAQGEQPSQQHLANAPEAAM